MAETTSWSLHELEDMSRKKDNLMLKFKYGIIGCAVINKRNSEDFHEFQEHLPEEQQKFILVQQAIYQ